MLASSLCWRINLIAMDNTGVLSPSAPLCAFHVVSVVFVKKLSGNTIALRLQAGFGVVTVGDIKRMLAAHPDGFPASSQCLIFLGAELADDSYTLDQCGVANETTMHLIERACKTSLQVEEEVEVSNQRAQEVWPAIAASTATVWEQAREERVVKIVVVGATGSGKSALCGAIAALLGGDTSAFPSSDGASAHTMKPNAGCFSCPHMGNVVLLDVPGLLDPRGAWADEANIRAIVDFVKLHGFMNRLVLVLNEQNTRFDRSLQDVFQAFADSFGIGVLDVMCLTFTHAFGQRTRTQAHVKAAEISRLVAQRVGVPVLRVLPSFQVDCFPDELAGVGASPEFVRTVKAQSAASLMDLVRLASATVPFSTTHAVYGEFEAAKASRAAQAAAEEQLARIIQEAATEAKAQAERHQEVMRASHAAQAAAQEEQREHLMRTAQTAQAAAEEQFARFVQGAATEAKTQAEQHQEVMRASNAAHAAAQEEQRKHLMRTAQAAAEEHLARLALDATHAKVLAEAQARAYAAELAQVQAQTQFEVQAAQAAVQIADLRCQKRMSLAAAAADQHLREQQQQHAAAAAADQHLREQQQAVAAAAARLREQQQAAAAAADRRAQQAAAAAADRRAQQQAAAAAGWSRVLFGVRFRVPQKAAVPAAKHRIFIRAPQKAAVPAANQRILIRAPKKAFWLKQQWFGRAAK